MDDRCGDRRKIRYAQVFGPLKDKSVISLQNDLCTKTKRDREIERDRERGRVIERDRD